jgi:two-component system, cell cycle sensor histidine kinase and response regulator CckA
MLEGPGYEVATETDSLAALERFKAYPEQFDLIITDMTMPHITGDRLVQKILKIRSDFPIILCTGYSDKLSEERAKEIGIRKYIEKPIEKETLAR